MSFASVTSNFFGGIFMEMLVHFPLIHMNSSSYKLLWIPGYTVSTFLVAAYFAILYNLRKESTADLAKLMPTMAGIGTSFLFTVTYISPIFSR